MFSAKIFLRAKNFSGVRSDRIPSRGARRSIAARVSAI
jgi:hypothetical protein